MDFTKSLVNMATEVKGYVDAKDQARAKTIAEIQDKLNSLRLPDGETITKAFEQQVSEVKAEFIGQAKGAIEALMEDYTATASDAEATVQAAVQDVQSQFDFMAEEAQAKQLHLVGEVTAAIEDTKFSLDVFVKAAESKATEAISKAAGDLQDAIAKFEQVKSEHDKFLETTSATFLDQVKAVDATTEQLEARVRRAILDHDSQLQAVTLTAAEVVRTELTKATSTIKDLKTEAGQTIEEARAAYTKLENQTTEATIKAQEAADNAHAKVIDLAQKLDASIHGQVELMAKAVETVKEDVATVLKKADQTSLELIKATTDVLDEEISRAKTAQELLYSVVDTEKKAIESFVHAVENVKANLVTEYDSSVITKQGTYVHHNGDLFITLADTDADPNLSTKYVRLHHTPIHHKGHNAEEHYLKGDTVLSSRRSRFVALKDFPQGKPGESEDWRLFVPAIKGEDGLPGVKGDKGDRGDSGKDGISIKAMYITDTGVAIEKSDGTMDVSSFDWAHAMAQVIEAREQSMDLPIREFATGWRSGDKYKRGTVVNFDNNLYIAKKDTSGDAAPLELIDAQRINLAAEEWQLVVSIPKKLVVDPAQVKTAVDSEVADLQAKGLIATYNDAALKADMTAKFNAVQTQLDLLDADDVVTKADMLQINQDLTAAETARATLAAKVTALETTNGNLTGKITALETANTQLTAMNTSLTALLARVTALETKTGALHEATGGLKVTGTLATTGDITAFAP